jgi:hypothetical protein
MTTSPRNKANDATKAIRALWALGLAIFLQEYMAGNVDWRGLVVMAAAVLSFLLVKKIYSALQQKASHRNADQKNIEASWKFSLHQTINKVHHDVK